MRKFWLLFWALAGSILAIILYFIFKIIYTVFEVIIPNWIMKTIVIFIAVLCVYIGYSRRNK